MPDMMPTSLVAVVAPHTGKIIKYGPVFLKEEQICYKKVLHYVFKLSHMSEIVFIMFC